MNQHHYMTVISPGPLMIVRVPWPRPLWRHTMRAMTAVMRDHGMRQKDLHQLDGMVPEDPLDRDDKDHAFAARLDAAFDGTGATVLLPKFWLYDWRDGAFKLVRPGATP